MPASLFKACAQAQRPCVNPNRICALIVPQSIRMSRLNLQKLARQFRIDAGKRRDSIKPPQIPWETGLTYKAQARRSNAVEERSWRDGCRRRRSDSAARNCCVRRRCLQRFVRRRFCRHNFSPSTSQDAATSATTRMYSG